MSCDQGLHRSGEAEHVERNSLKIGEKKRLNSVGIMLHLLDSIH